MSALLAGLLGVAGAGGAAADGAQVTHINASSLNGCADNGVQTMCVDLHGESQIVSTPSGTQMTNTEFGGTETFSLDNGGGSETIDVRHLGSHITVNQEGADVIGVHFEETITSSLGGTQQTCTFILDEHATSEPDGTVDVQYDRQSLVCTP
jgi:hypothetical protein